MKSRRTQLSYLWNCSRQLRTAAFDCLSSVSESEDGDLHATMSANQSPARTFTEARDPCCSSGNRERQQRRSKGCQDWKPWKRQSQEHDRKERENVKGPGQVKRGHHVASFATSLATWAEGQGQVKRDHHVASFSNQSGHLCRRARAGQKGPPRCFICSQSGLAEGQGQVKRAHHVASFATSLATCAEGQGQVKRGHHVASFVTSLAWPKGKGRSKGTITLLHFLTSLATCAEGQRQVKMGHHVASFVTSLAWPKGKGRSKGAITLLHL